MPPTAEVAEYIAATYSFDEIRVEPTALSVTGGRWVLSSSPLRVEIVASGRTPVGALLRLVPRPLARARWWTHAIGPIAARMRDGVRTVGTAGGGRREYYCALDERRLSAVHARLAGEVLGELRPVSPPVRFGFGSTPSVPSLVRVTTTIVRGPALTRSAPPH